jgi:hypothetical protein
MPDSSAMRLVRQLRMRGRARNASTAAVLLSGVCMISLAGSVTGRHTGDVGWWVGGSVVAALSAAAGLYLLGRSHEAAHANAAAVRAARLAERQACLTERMAGLELLCRFYEAARIERSPR